jgi:long-chain acyl-CoA synthetase
MDRCSKAILWYSTSEFDKETEVKNFTFFPVSQGKPFPLKGLTLPELIKNQAERFGGKTLLKFKDKAVSYREFDIHTGRLAKAFENLGVKKGDRIAIMFQNCLEILESYFAIWKTGAWAVPVSPVYTPREVEYVLSDAGAKMIIAGEDQYSRIEPIRAKVPSLETVVLKGTKPIPKTISYDTLSKESQVLESVAITPEDVCQIMYTSGTEGTPKGVMTPHGAYTDNALIRSSTLELNEKDTTVIPLPMFHMFAISTLLNFITVGGTVIITERFQAEEVLELIHRNKITFFTGVPTMYSYLLSHPKIDEYDLSSLRLCIIAGGNVNYKVVEDFENKFGSLFIESMGQTELSPTVMMNPPHRDKRRLGSCGLTLFNMETRLVDEDGNDVPLGETGELVVKCPCVMKGYYNLPEENKKVFRDGWLHTGDLLKQDKEGYYFFVDRKKDMIVTAGYNIYAKEIENILLKHPDVLEAAVIAIPDEVKGQLAKAVIVRREGGSLTEENIDKFAREYLAPYKVPRIIKFVESLPHTPQGKIAKGVLREIEGQK